MNSLIDMQEAEEAKTVAHQAWIISVVAAGIAVLALLVAILR